ncbi:FBP domain-containing protein [Actinomadura sp. WAC 06369]|uniref:FBP domain-containing protein n=1 Tax=Actinomadura sp. WAC 06369 TaxID=2203193 RepID=UPI000F794E04|nr:FBP domain-containing protein [Actinomadura sp. WAC 06369]RSN40396.1 hypothetical protein DMH08_39540 [Actinomadura sp. WAC 06369]
MKPLTEHDVRRSFVNCSKGEAKRLNLPKDFAELPWDDLDFLGWRDPRAPERAWLVAERGGVPVGVALRAVESGSRGFTARSMCSLCMATRSGGGVALMTARRTGEAGRQGDSVGQYVCADLACSLYVRGLRKTIAAGGMDALPQRERIVRARGHLDAFLDKITR